MVLANLSVHKSATARRLVEGARCRLVFLPIPSPNPTPIEHAFATCKQALRRPEARSFETLVPAVGAALTAVSPADARGFCRAAGSAT